MTLRISGGGGISQSSGDARYVLKTGDVMTGDLELDDCKQLILQSCDNSIESGSPMGLLLALTYPTTTGVMKRWAVTVNDSGNLITTEL